MGRVLKRIGPKSQFRAFAQNNREKQQHRHITKYLDARGHPTYETSELCGCDGGSESTFTNPNIIYWNVAKYEVDRQHFRSEHLKKPHFSQATAHDMPYNMGMQCQNNTAVKPSSRQEPALYRKRPHTAAYLHVKPIPFQRVSLEIARKSSSLQLTTSSRRKCRGRNYTCARHACRGRAAV